MRKKLEIPLGSKFGKLTVIKDISSLYKNRGSYWLCKCSCGAEKVVRGCHLNSGKVMSCGCFRNEILRTSGGLSKTRIYRIWAQFRNRCKNKNHSFYKYYGGRKIYVCTEWDDDFLNFYNWAINNGYRDDLTIDRIDVNGNYCPENCRWVDKKIQARNRRNNIWIFYNGKNDLLCNWLKFFNKSATSYYTLKKNGHSDCDIFNEWGEEK